jgi:hypothetical protein
VSALIALIVLIDAAGGHVFNEPENTSLGAFANASTWVFLIISGLFYTIGSFAFVRAFSNPPRAPLFTWRHFETDELLGCWCNFLGTAPSIFYCLVYLYYEPHQLVYWAGLFASFLFTGATAFFVYSTYGETEETRRARELAGKEPIHLMRSVFKKVGLRKYIIHVNNDWLTACWFFFFCSFIWAFGSFVLLLADTANERQAFIYSTSLLDAILFTLGSAYFVSGSYPQEGSKFKISLKDDEVDDGVVVNALHQDREANYRESSSPSPREFESSPASKASSTLLRYEKPKHVGDDFDEMDV